jgi:hypothetical protein
MTRPSLDSLWERYKYIASNPYSSSQATQAIVSNVSSQLIRHLYSLRQLALFEYQSTFHSLSIPVPRFPSRPRIARPAFAPLLNRSVKFNQLHIERILSLPAPYSSYFVYVFFPAMFNFFACEPDLELAQAFFESIGGATIRKPIFQDLVATFVWYAVRFQDELYNRCLQGNEFEDALNQSICFLSKWHVLVLKKMEHCFASILGRAVERIRAQWGGAEPFVLNEEFAMGIFEKLSPEACVESPSLGAFFGMVHELQDSFLVSELDSLLCQFILSGTELPPFDPSLALSLQILRRKSRGAGEPVRRRKVQAPALVMAEWVVHRAEWRQDRMERLRGKRVELVRYGLEVEITQAEDTEREHAELQHRILGVALLQIQARCADDLVDRVACLLGRKDSGGETLWQLKHALAEPEFREEGLERELVQRGFERYRSGRMQTLLLKQPLKTECREVFVAKTNAPVATAIGKNWEWISKQNGGAILGWDKVGELVLKIEELQWEDLENELPRWISPVFEAAYDLAVRLNAEVPLDSKLLANLEALRRNLGSYLELER